MGMFESLFGSAGSDKSDKYYQQAIQAFNSVKTPELSSLQVQLDKYVQAGQLTPQQAEAALLNSNAFNDIKTDPSLVGAQKQALQQLQTTANEGGLTALDRSKINDIQDTLNTTARGRNQAITQNARERGIGGSGLELTNQLMNEQSAADTASRAGTDVAAQAQARALQALQAAGTLGGQMEAQQYGEQANKATAQNAIDKFNAETSNQTNLYNTQTANAAQAANLANKQAVGNANVAAENANKRENANANQTVFQDELAKAQGVGGVAQNAAKTAQETQNQENAADMALTGGLINAGVTGLTAGFGGPVAAAALPATTQMTPQYGKVLNANPNLFGAHGGEVPGYAEGCYAEGGMIEIPKAEMIEEHERLIPQLEGKEKELQSTELKKIKKEEPKKEEAGLKGLGNLLGSHADEANRLADMRDGGKVPGKAKVKGDSEKNDTVPAMLSPGEVVVPRTAANDEEEFEKFMHEHMKRKMARGGLITPPAAPKMPITNPKPVSTAVPRIAPLQPRIPPVVPHDHVSTALKSLQHRVTNLEGGR